MGRSTGDAGYIAAGLPAKGGAIRISHSRRVGSTVKLRDELTSYFAQHPDQRGWHWHQRKFASIRAAHSWYQWLHLHADDHGIRPPEWATSVRGACVYITLRSPEGLAWNSDGRPVPQPLTYRRSLEQGEKE